MAKEINKIVATGGTKYEKAFKKAFELLDQAKNDEFGAILCPNTVNVVLFLTDGIP